MKLLRLLPIAALAFAAVSCQESGSGDSLQAGATRSDSLMYYLGKMRAADYAREAKRDTTMDSPEAKRAYVQGMQAGMTGVRADDEAYNKGFMQGIQMAMNMKDFTDNYGLKLNPQVFIQSLNAGLAADSLPPSREIQQDFRKVMNQISDEKEEKDKMASRETLSQQAAGLGLPKINDDLYGKVTSTADGQQLKKGDDVTFQVKVTKMDGSPVNGPSPSKGKVGARNLPEPLNQALETLKSGEEGEYVTSAHAYYGQRCKQVNLTPTDLVKFTLKAEMVKEEEKK